MQHELLERLKSSLTAYTVERELAAGGMATVFLAREVALDRAVVLKVLPDRASEIDAERFRREVALAARLQHPNIVPLLAAGTADGLLYYVMPHVEGASLRERLKSATLISLAESVRLLRDIARALAYAHEHDVVHRDIKPENVLLSGRAAAVTDFGIAKALSTSRRVVPGYASSAQLTSAGSTVGTLAYMAPEQAVGDDVDHRADIYSFGVMAYEILAGELPFTGRTAQELMASHLRDKPSPLLEKEPDLPPALVDLVMRCLEKEPAARPQTAAELVDALEVIGPSSGSRSTATFRRARKSQRRLAFAAGLATTAAVALVLAAPIGLPEDPVRAIAVLPFANLSGDPSNDFLGDGISEELIATLSRLPELSVAARTSSFAFKNANADLATIGNALDIGAVLAGSVRRSGDHLRVSAELTRVSDGLLLWRNTYDRRIGDVIAVQEEIARSIVAALELRVFQPGALDRNIASAQPMDLARRPTSDITAYELYLRGRFEWGRRKLESLRLALAYYDSAAKLDPGFALAHAGIADAYIVLGNWGYLPTKEAGERSLAAASRAVDVDSMLAEGHASLGSVLCTYVWDWPASERAFQRSIQLNPGLATTRYFYSRGLLGHGRVEDAMTQGREAARLDPLNAHIATALSSALMVAERSDSAIAIGERALRHDPANAAARFWLATTYIMNGDMAKAREVADAMSLEERRSPLMTSLAGAIAAMTGDREHAAASIEALMQQSDANAFNIGMVHAALGEHEAALRWFARAESARSDGFVVFGRVVPWLAPLRDDLRFEAMLTRVLGASQPPIAPAEAAAERR